MTEVMPEVNPPMREEPDALLRVRGMKKHFPIEGGLLKRTVGHVRAVDGVDFDVKQGAAFGIVGESGCGKSTLGRCLLRLLEPTAGRVLMREPESGAAAVGGESGADRAAGFFDVASLEKAALKRFRTDAQMIFQDPAGSLNNRMTIGQLIQEPLLVHGRLGDDRGESRVQELLRLVGLSAALRSRFPHEISGGQRQRIAIARALALDPRLVICDEAVSALDVSVRAQVLNLLARLQERLGLTYIFVSHDLGVVRHFCHRVAVLYLGRIVEMAPADRLFASPQHPYTMSLLSAIPRVGRKKRDRQIILGGDVPSPADPPPGCPFHPRCWAAQDVCRRDMPPLLPMRDDPRHLVACHFTGEIPPWTPTDVDAGTGADAGADADADAGAGASAAAGDPHPDPECEAPHVPLSTPPSA